MFPVLTTERLTLTELTKAHAPALFHLFTDKKVTQFYPVLPFRQETDLLPVIETFSDRFIAKQGIRWGITLTESKECIGAIGFQSYTENQKGNLVFALMPAHHGGGYATEAMRAVLRYGFEDLDLKRIEAEVMPGNTASEKVLQKTGFTHEGLLRNWLYWDSGCFDINMYAICK